MKLSTLQTLLMSILIPSYAYGMVIRGFAAGSGCGLGMPIKVVKTKAEMLEGIKNGGCVSYEYVDYPGKKYEGKFRAN